MDVITVTTVAAFGLSVVVASRFRSLFQYNRNIEHLRNQAQTLENLRFEVQQHVDAATSTNPEIEHWLNRVRNISNKVDTYLKDAAVQQRRLEDCLPWSRYSVSVKAKKLTKVVVDLIIEAREMTVSWLASSMIIRSTSAGGLDDFESREGSTRDMMEIPKDDEKRDADVVFEDKAKDEKGSSSASSPNLRSPHSLKKEEKKKSTVVDGLQGDTEIQIVVEIGSTSAGDFDDRDDEIREYLSDDEKKTRLFVESRKFDDVYYYTAPQVGIASQSTGGLKDYNSRISTMKDILEALTDNEIHMIGICGIPGIGKTTIMKEVAIKVKEDKLFDEVVMAVVGRELDVERIQCDVAERMGLKLREQSWSRRAIQLHERLKDAKRVLVILDDVWKMSDFNKIGIPSRGDCKIVLVSHFREVCYGKGTQKNIVVEPLPFQEGTRLFSQIVGNSSHTLLPQISEAVCDTGLPLLLFSAGRALKSKNTSVWETVLDQLRRHGNESISGVLEQMFMFTQLSYNHLQSEETKSCLLLCSLFPGDSNIPIEDLVRYGMGLRLFKHVNLLNEVRDRIYESVEELKSWLLLLPGDNKESVRMNAFAYHFAISIASRGNRNFFIRTKRTKKANSCTSISMVAKKKRNWRRPVELLQRELAHDYLDTIWHRKVEFVQLKNSYDSLKTIKNQIVLLQPERADDSWDTIRRMKKLKVLELQALPISSLPSTVGSLASLRTLCLHNCKRLKNISIIRELSNLEILSFDNCGIGKLPEEIGKLQNLRLLDLRKCNGLKIISPGVISGLSRLEELYMGYGFQNWEAVKQGEERRNSSLKELESLSCLTTLEIVIPEFELFPQNMLLAPNLRNYTIAIGDWGFGDWEFQDYPFDNNLALKLRTSTPLGNAIKMLFERSDRLFLQGNGSQIAVKELLPGVFQRLKYLSISDCHVLEYLADSVSSTVAVFPILESMYLADLPNLKEICHGQLTAGASFGKLYSLTLNRCDSLKNLFSQSIARGMVQLQKLAIIKCEMIEEVVSKHENGVDEATNDKIEFPKLKYLELKELPRLACFCQGMDEVEFPQLTHLFISDLPALTSFCPTKSLASERNHDAVLQSLFHKKLAFPSLEVLELDGLTNLEGIAVDQLPDGSLSKLRKMTLLRLPKLAQIYNNDDCSVIEELITEEEQEEGRMVKILFPQLTHLELRDLPKLTNFCYMKCASELPLLGKVAVQGCPNMKTFSTGSLRTPMLEGIHVGQHKRVWMGTLNKTIQGLFQEKESSKGPLNATIRTKEFFKQQLEKISEDNEEDSSKGSLDATIRTEEFVKQPPQKIPDDNEEDSSKGSLDATIRTEEFVEQQLDKIPEDDEEDTSKGLLDVTLKTEEFAGQKSEKILEFNEEDSSKVWLDATNKTEEFVKQQAQKISKDNEKDSKINSLYTVKTDELGKQPQENILTTIAKRPTMDKNWTNKYTVGIVKVALQAFIAIDWEYYKPLFQELEDTAFDSFKLSVFKAITKFVLRVYDQEDFENVVNIREIYQECEKFTKEILNQEIKSKDEPLKEIFQSTIVLLNDYSMIREQDVCNILEWYQQEYDPDHPLEMQKRRPKKIDSFVVEPCGFSEYYVKKAMECMNELTAKELPKIEEYKKHLRMELKDCKCFCTLDACYMESWKEIKIPEEKESDSYKQHDRLEDLVSSIHNVIYDLADLKIAALEKCQSLAVFPLASEVFGEWNEEVFKVVRDADMERRNQGCRFIEVDHLFICLGRSKIGKSISKLENERKKPDAISIGDSIKKLKHKVPVYDLYKLSYQVAKRLDHPKVGLEHLSIAIVYGNDVEKFEGEIIMSEPGVKEFLKSVKNDEDESIQGETHPVEGVKNGKDVSTGEETYTVEKNLWSGILPGDFHKRYIDGSVLKVVKEIQSRLESPSFPFKFVEHNWKMHG